MRVWTSVYFCGRAAAVALLGAVALSACSVDPEEKAPQCPTALVPRDAATLARYDGRGTDLTNLVVSAELVNVKGVCKGMLGHNNVASTVHAEMIVTRGPASQGRDIDLAYNLAVMHQGQLLDHRAFTQHITFPVNVDTVHVTGQDVFLTIPAPRGLGAQDYKLYFVLALTPEELAANRKALNLP